VTTAAAPITATLTPRQYEIMALKLRGLSNPEIAARLSLAIDTVRTTVVNAYDRIEDAGWYGDDQPRRRLNLLIIAVMSGQVRLEVGSLGRYARGHDSAHD